MLTRFFTGLLLLVSFCAIVCRSAIPDYIKVCSASEPDLAACIKNTIEELRPQLKDGIPELDVPPVEPLHLDEMKLRRGPSNAHFSANISDVHVWGPSSFQIKELKVSLPKNKFAFKVVLPHIHFEGKYDIDMQILFVQFKGKGPIIGNFTNYAFNALMQGHKVIRDGEEYLEFSKMKLKIHMGKADVQLKNLFNSDPILGKASNDLLNENTDLFLNEIRPSLEQSLAEKFTEIANKITLKFTYKELFP